MDFAIFACVFGLIKDSIIRVSMVRNRRSTFLLSLSSGFVCDTPFLVVVSLVHSEVSRVGLGLLGEWYVSFLILLTGLIIMLNSRISIGIPV